MVFGWGKKKIENQVNITPKEKEISLSDIEKIIKDIRILREKTLVTEIKSFKKKISSQLNELSGIVNQLEKDDLKTDDIDKHLKIIVTRGKSLVISTIKKETSLKLTEPKTVDDVEQFHKELSQILKRMGDVLGRQTRVIHIFAKKYAKKLKDTLSSLNSDISEVNTLLNNYKKLDDNCVNISNNLEKISSLEQLQKDVEKRLDNFHNSINSLDEKIDGIKQDIEKLKLSNEHSKFLAIKKQIDELETDKQQIKNEIDLQFIKISRPLSKYEYVSSLDKPQKVLMGKLIDRPFDVLMPKNKDDIIIILQAARKGVQSGSVSVKDSDKSVIQIDETTEMLDSFIQKVSEFASKKNKLEDSLKIFNVQELNQKMSELDKADDDKKDVESKIQTYETEISDSKKQIPQLILDIETKLQAASSSKYKII